MGGPGVDSPVETRVLAPARWMSDKPPSPAVPRRLVLAQRALWKGFLTISEITCPVGLYTAASTSDRIAFHMVNRATGHRINRQFVDGETGKPVSREEQVKGYDQGGEDYIILEPDEIAAAIPEGDKSIAIGSFISCNEIDTLFFDKPYHLRPVDRTGAESFALIRAGMLESSVAAIGTALLFRRMRTLLIRPTDDGMIATTLNFDYEVQSAEKAFEGVKARKIDAEMLDLARHIIDTKRGQFDPAEFDDRYEEALASLVKAKIEGKAPPKRAPVKPTPSTDLLEALRQSVGGGKAPAKTSKTRAAAPKKAPAGKKPAAAAERRKAS